MWIHYELGGKYKWRLTSDMVTYPVPLDITFSGEYLCVRGGTLLIKKGYCWDGASGPAIDTANFMGASLVHDALYQLMREGVIPRSFRKTADKILREICLADGMSKPRAWWVYIAVRIGAGKSAKRRRE